MLGASCGLELSERVLTKHRNPEDTEDVMTLASPRKCPILVSQVNQIGWSPSVVQSQQQPDPKRHNPHTLVPGESGLMMTPYQ